MFRPRVSINRLVWIIAVLVMAISVYRYTNGVLITLGYRTGLLPLQSLPTEMQHWLPGIPLWQDVIYLAGYLGVIAALILLVSRRKAVLWMYGIAAGIAKIDWALLSPSPEPLAVLLGWSAFVQYFVILSLVILLRQRRFLH
ncbi:hypothetical protein [Maricaulis sp.]|uniref:hypothetical protein n=1 Tax=Maricaulis sp. TaxID=1486257 RepID=UPI002B269ACF|nr:hypothetical protein [Maricaulis sp.]